MFYYKKESVFIEQVEGCRLIGICDRYGLFSIISINRAINKIKETASTLDMSDGKALELMAGDYLAGAEKDNKDDKV